LEGKAFVASVFNASPKEMMARFSCHPIDVICRPSVGKVDYEVRFRRTLEGHSLTPAEWRDFHGACAMIGRSDALLEIGASGKSLVQLDLGSGLPANVERHEWFARVAHRLERLNDATGREFGIVREHELEKSNEPVQRALDLLGLGDNSDGVILASTDLADSLDDVGEPTRYGAFFRFDIAGKLLAVGVNCMASRVIDGDRLRWNFHNITQRAGEVVAKEGYLDFVERTKRFFGLEKTFVGRS
jgi:hypothetical protein